MTLHSDVFDALGGNAALAAVVGTRIYPNQAAQGVTAPYVVWQVVSTVPTNDLDGSAVSSSVENSRVQVTYWAKKMADAAAGDQLVRTAMFAATAFKALHADYREPGFEPDTKLYGAQSDFSIWRKT